MTSTLDPNIKGWLDEDQSSSTIVPPKKKFKLFGGENSSTEEGRRGDSPSPLVIDASNNSTQNSTQNTPVSTPSTPKFSNINARIQTLTTPKHSPQVGSNGNHRNGENHKTIEHNKNVIDCSPFSLFGNSTIEHKPVDSPRIPNGTHNTKAMPSTPSTKNPSPNLSSNSKEEKIKKEEEKKEEKTIKTEGETTPSGFRKNKRRVETSESSSSSGSDSESSEGEQDDPLSKKQTQKDIERREKLWENLKQQLKDSSTSTRVKRKEIVHAHALSTRRKREQDHFSDSTTPNGNHSDHASNSSLSANYLSSEGPSERKKTKKEKKEKRKQRDSKSESDKDDSKNGWMHHFKELRKLKQGDGSFKLKSSTFMYRWLHNQSYNARTGKLSKERAQLLRDIGVNFEKVRAKKSLKKKKKKKEGDETNNQDSSDDSDNSSQDESGSSSSEDESARSSSDSESNNSSSDGSDSSGEDSDRKSKFRIRRRNRERAVVEDSSDDEIKDEEDLSIYKISSPPSKTKEEDVSSLHKRISQLEKQLNSLGGDLSDTKKLLSSKQRQLDNANDQIGDLQSELRAIKKLIPNIKGGS